MQSKACSLLAVDEPLQPIGSIKIPMAMDVAFKRTLLRSSAMVAVFCCSVGAVVLPIMGSPVQGVDVGGMTLSVIVTLIISLLLLRFAEHDRAAKFLALAACCMGANAITHSMMARDGSEIVILIFITLMWAAPLLPANLMVLACIYNACAPWLFGAKIVPTTFYVTDPSDINGLVLGTISILSFGISMVFQRAVRGLRDAHLTNLSRFEQTRSRLEASLRLRSEELDISREQGFRAEKIRTVGTLAAGLAHELNNILTPARGFAEILAAGGTSPAQASDFGRRILDATIASTTITKALLTYTKQSVFSPENVSLRILLDTQIRPVLGQVIPDDVELLVTCPRRIILVVDSLLFQQLITNLVLNAVDATARGGHITIEARSVDGITGDIPYAEIVVSDDGEGMSPEQIAQIFDPFFTTKKHGTGLGLPTVQGIVERHNGSIEVVSHEGEGTMVTLRLPIARSVGHADTDHQFDSEGENDSDPIAVLFTGDEDLFDELEEMMLEADIPLQRAPSLSSIDEAYTLDESVAFVDIVLIDIDDWDASFESAVELIRRHVPLLALIVLSSSGTSVATIRRSEGPVSSLRKPVVRSELNATLAALRSSFEVT